MGTASMADKVALITGAGSGIGRATALLSSGRGAITIVADVDQVAARSVVEQITSAGGSAEDLLLDVADEASWASAVRRVLDVHGRLDVLVNNAGISDVSPISETTYGQWRAVLSVNLDGVFLGIKQAIAVMRPGGSIVNVASVSGITPAGGAASYCAGKAAVRMLSKAAAIECADAGNGIRVNVVTPGGVRTPMWEKQAFFREMVRQHGGTEAAFAAMEGDAASQRFLTSDEVAETIVYLASDDSAHLTGVEIVLDRGHSS